MIYSNTAGGRFNVQLGGLTPGTEHDQLKVNGTANLAGTRFVDFLNGFVPSVGNSFTVMTYTAHSGSFSGVVAPPGITLQPAYYPTHLVLNAVTVTQVPPFIITQPTNLTVKEGLTATFRVVAGGTPTLTYQWQMNSTDLPGATSDTLVIPNVAVSHAGSYRVIVSNLGGFTNSVNALLLVEPGFSTVEIDIGVTNALTGVSFFNGYLGAAIGSNGVMRITRDGGSTWTAVDTGMTTVADVQFVGGAIYIVGSGPHTICVSYDGGVTWQPAYSGPQRLTRRRFYSPNYGVAVGEGGAVVVWDGSTWTPYTVDPGVDLWSLDFCGGVPVAVGDAGRVYAFTGTNWVLRSTVVSLATLNDVRFCGRGGTGFAVGRGGVIYRTTDCGLSWEPYNNMLYGGSLNSITFGDCNTWWLAGDDGTLLFSSDGGATWGAIYTGTTNRITSVIFRDGVGYYVDDGGHIHRFLYGPIPSNPPPVVSLITPPNRFTNYLCVPLKLEALASDPNGFVTNVEFFAGPVLLGARTLPPYRTLWENEVPGEFTLTAVALDNLGARAVSAPVTVLGVPPPLHVLTLGGFTSNRVFRICMNGEAGRDYDVHASTNLAGWGAIGRMFATNGIWEYWDTSATNYAHRFYRAQQVPAGP